MTTRALTPPELDWEQIDTVLCDMDGTLLDLGFDNYFWLEVVPRVWGEQRGLSQLEAHAELMPIFNSLRGQLDWYCLDYWSGRLELDLSALKHDYRQRIGYLPGIESALEDLRARGFGLHLVTNAHPESLRIKDLATGVSRHFDACHSTHDFGHPKEVPAFWPAFSAHAELDLSRCLLVDDTDSVLEGALRGGVGQVLAVRRIALNLPPKERTGHLPELDSLADIASLLD